MHNSVDDARIDTYWKLLSDRYPMLCMPVYSIMSIVPAPKVECIQCDESCVGRAYNSAQHGNSFHDSNYQVLL